MITAFDSVIPWINQLRPLEVVGVIATGMAAISAACVAAIAALKYRKPAAQQEVTGDQWAAVCPLILGDAFFAEFDGDYDGRPNLWVVYSYQDAAEGKDKVLFELASKENAAALVTRLDVAWGWISAHPESASSPEAAA